MTINDFIDVALGVALGLGVAIVILVSLVRMALDIWRDE